MIPSTQHSTNQKKRPYRDDLNAHGNTTLYKVASLIYVGYDCQEIPPELTRTMAITINQAFIKDPWRSHELGGRAELTVRPQPVTDETVQAGWTAKRQVFRLDFRPDSIPWKQAYGYKRFIAGLAKEVAEQNLAHVSKVGYEVLITVTELFFPKRS